MPLKPKPIKLSEKDIGRLCDDAASACGWATEKYEQPRATLIQQGLPDRRYVRNGQRVWVELKRPGGKLTEGQYAWLKTELSAGGMATVIDHPEMLIKLLQMLGRRSSTLEAAARALCEEWVDLTWKRGAR